MNTASESEKQIYQFLQEKLRVVFLYENLSLLKYAVDIVPTEDLSMKAMLKLSLLENSDSTIAFEDLLLLELLNWFKCSFFTWIDIPKCESCGQLPRGTRRIVPPDETELTWRANQVEQYFCKDCQTYIRFPRYTHPRKLLETRTGRCGEWANCFTLLCRALGYDTRLVFDWNDHVWTEVFSFSKSQWLHCDPCENICDKPLMYEVGWKKPTSYILAISKDEVQDVTWRYTTNFHETLKRRKLCREEWLLNCISKFIEKLQSNVSPERRQELTRRRIFELAQFLTEPKADEDYGGRTSGSLAWRIARGEAHLSPTNSAYVFEITEKEMSQRHLHVRYSCALDKYIRVSDESVEIENWTACCFDQSNVFRKVESDWKVAYLARNEESDKGVISWKFNFKGTGVTVRTLRLHLKCATFENGKVKWLISSESDPDISKTFLNDEVISLKTEDFKGSTGLILTAELTEGSGIAAWQHAQLFRQAIDSTDFPFEIEISLDKH